MLKSRRGFLGGLAAGAGLLAAPSIVRAASMKVSLSSSATGFAEPPTGDTLVHLPFNGSVANNGTTTLTPSYNLNSFVDDGWDGQAHNGGAHLTYNSNFILPKEGPWCVDCRVRRLGSVGNGYIIDGNEGWQGSFILNNPDSDMRPHIYAQQNGYLDTPTGVTLDLGRWYHIAFTYDGTTIRFFLDGVMLTSQTTAIAADLLYTNQLHINQYGGGNFKFGGDIDEVRMLVGSPVWTSNFTPPSAPY